ncbi:glycosyltransferase [Trichlorobacter lovleyi]|uniref:CgeB family protein n=1 Tax=Trichlorobacter lovleyi TaxID=313985 RepID=UPI0024816EA3|nr:glycosyltransferase [Trichlorobacter lovleyi]
MKLLLIFPNWLGRSGNYCHSAVLSLGHESHLVWGSDHDTLSFSGYFKDKARRFPYIKSVFTQRENKSFNTNITQKVKEIRPEIVINNCPSLYFETIQTLKENSRCLVYWAGDDPTLFPNLMKTLHMYDFFFAGAPGWLQGNISAIRKKHNYYLPYGCDPDVFKRNTLTKREQKEYGSSISFVGARYSDREQILSKLTDMDIAIWGWKKDNYLRRVYRKIRGEQFNALHDKYKTGAELYIPTLNTSIRSAYIDNHTANKIYNASSIILNLQHPQMLHAVNSKAFEIAAAGGFQLFQHSGNLLGLFQKDTEIICFSTIQELREQTLYFLNNPLEAEKIASRARKRVLKEHTFKHRVESILSTIGGC